MPEARPFRLAIPSICFMEALTVLNTETKTRNKFLEELVAQIREAGRDTTSESAKLLVENLDRARLAAKDWLRDFRSRLTQCLTLLAMHAELIALDPVSALDCLQNPIIDEPTDRLILHTILGHARSSEPGPKAFFSGNSRDFGQDAVTEALANVGVRYFATSRAAVGWLTSQSPN